MSLADLVAPPFLVAAALLGVSGAAKLVRPDAAVRALEQAGLPSSRTLVRGLALAELFIGVGCLAMSGPVWAALLAAVYAAFVGFLLRLLAMGSRAGSCGCMGGREAPPSLVHVVLDGVAALGGILAARVGTSSVADLVSGSRLLGVPLILGLAACAYAAYAGAVYLPQAWASYRPHADHGEGAHGQPQVFRLTTGAGT